MIPIPTTLPLRRRGRPRTASAQQLDGAIEPKVKGYDRTERQRILAAAERISLEQEEVFPFSCFAGIVMLTGLSPQEVLELHWEQSLVENPIRPWVDLKAWEVVVPAADVRRRSRHVPVIPPLAKLLMQWPRPRTGQLFPTTVTLAQIETLWARTRREAGVKPLALKDLNSTFDRMLREDRIVPTREDEIREPQPVFMPRARRAFPGIRARLR